MTAATATGLEYYQRIGLLRLGLLLAAAPTAGIGQQAHPSAQLARAAGRYVLTDAGGRQLPSMTSRLIPGEGSTIVGAILSLGSDGTFTSSIAVSITDSGTVHDTLQVAGLWRIENGQPVLEYVWSSPRWNVAYPRQLHHARSEGTTRSGGLELPRLGWLDERYFGGSVALRFKRVD